jgi:hypothetical protein
VSATAEQFYSDQFFDLMDYASVEFPILSAEHALTRLLVALKQCAATTDLGFRRWSHALLQTMADDIVRNQVTSFEEVIKIAQERDTEPKPPFIAEQNPKRPEITFVKIERGQGGRDSQIWIVPTDRLPLAQILHPTVEVRFMRIGNQRDPYLVKRCQRQLYSGAWDTVERDLGSIWLGIDEQFKSYEAKDGNYLNYSSGNLRPYSLPRLDALNFAAHPLWDEKDANLEDWKPERATAVPLNPWDNARDLRKIPLNAHGVEVARWLDGKEICDEPTLDGGITAIKHEDDPVPVDEAVKKLRKHWGADA